MYYPEANALVPRRVDPQSRTPAFKSVAISVAPLELGAAETVPTATDGVGVLQQGDGQPAATRGGMRAC